MINKSTSIIKSKNNFFGSKSLSLVEIPRPYTNVSLEGLKLKAVDTISKRGINRNTLTSIILNWRLRNE